MTDRSEADDVVLSWDVARLDVGRIHEFLTNEAYWCLGIPRAVVERAIRHSLCIGAYRGDVQLGFARLTPDRATFAYLSDVFVLPVARGRGVATRMVRALLEHDDVQGLRRLLLFTADAHALYAALGFSALARPERGMEIVRPEVYRSSAASTG